MAEQVAEPKKRLALDMDWLTAALAAIGLVFCLLGTVAVGWRALTGAPVKTQITWESVFLLLASVWLAVVTRERTAKFALGLFSLSIASRIILVLAHASVATQTLNAAVMRVVDLLIMLGFCLYILHWFKERVKHV